MKRVLDLILVLSTSPATLPAGIVVAAAIRGYLGKPILFKQQRAGYKGKPFTILKFRTMTDTFNNAGEPLSDHERLTRLGRLLRSSSLDELPQLINVLRGDMSLVGPRPLFTRYLPYYTNHETLRHSVRPGITGLAQVSGRNSVGWDDRLALDVEYAVTHRISDDFRIILRTLKSALLRDGISVVARDSGPPLDRWRSFPASDRGTMRRIEEADLPERTAWTSDPRVMKYMQFTTIPTLETTVDWYHRHRANPLRADFVFDSHRGHPIAMSGLVSDIKDPGSAELYVFVSPAIHGQGIGTWATELTCAWAFKHRDIRQVKLTTHLQNHAAVRIYKNLGFQVVKDEGDRIEMTLQRGM